MKRCLLLCSLFISLFASAQVDKAIPSPKKPARLYNDFTKGENFLQPYQVDELERKLVAYDDSTSNQVAIVVVDDLQGYDANQFATAIGDKWGVGGSEKFDNGIVILISTGGGEGNRDAYIAVGRGLEGAIPDMTAGSIVEDVLIPYFKQGNYYRGLDETVNSIMKAAAGEYQAPMNYGSKKKDFGGLTKAILLFIVIILIFVFGGASGGTGGGYVSSGGFGGWSGGSSGGWSGGSSGGGFGGFGGGSFGGGGAGGKW